MSEACKPASFNANLQGSMVRFIKSSTRYGTSTAGGGVKLTHPDRYKKLGNEMKIVMDTGNDWVWLDTSDRQDVLDAGVALVGLQRVGFAYVFQDGADPHFRDGAFRCSLRV